MELVCFALLSLFDFPRESVCFTCMSVFYHPIEGNVGLAHGHISQWSALLNVISSHWRKSTFFALIFLKNCSAILRLIFIMTLV
jgi:hypothetical protein